MNAIVEHEQKLDRSTYEVLGILSALLLDKTPIKELFIEHSVNSVKNNQLTLKFI